MNSAVVELRNESLTENLSIWHLLVLAMWQPVRSVHVGVCSVIKYSETTPVSREVLLPISWHICRLVGWCCLDKDRTFQEEIQKNIATNRMGHTVKFIESPWSDKETLHHFRGFLISAFCVATSYFLVPWSRCGIMGLACLTNGGPRSCPNFEGTFCNIKVTAADDAIRKSGGNFSWSCRTVGLSCS